MSGASGGRSLWELINFIKSCFRFCPMDISAYQTNAICQTSCSCLSAVHISAYLLFDIKTTTFDYFFDLQQIGSAALPRLYVRNRVLASAPWTFLLISQNTIYVSLTTLFLRSHSLIGAIYILGSPRASTASVFQVLWWLWELLGRLARSGGCLG